MGQRVWVSQLRFFTNVALFSAAKQKVAHDISIFLHHHEIRPANRLNLMIFRRFFYFLA